MSKKNLLIGAGIIGTGFIGYKIGENLAYIRCAIYGLKLAEDLFPGFKKTALKKITNNIIDSIFDKKEQAR